MVKYYDLLHMVQFRLWQKYGYTVNRAYEEMNVILEQEGEHVGREVFEEIMLFDLREECAPQRKKLESIAGALKIPVNDPNAMKAYARQYVSELSDVYVRELDGEDRVFDLGGVIRKFAGPLPDKVKDEKENRRKKNKASSKYPVFGQERILAAADEPIINHEHDTEKH